MVLGAVAWLSLKPAAPVKGAPIGLFTTLPIVWSDEGGFGAELNPAHREHWAKALLDARGGTVPLETLTPQSLAPLKRLVIAQPRVLAPAENVALDNWVRAGGQLLLLVDPAYTEESGYALGDPRRPPAAAMLSPILARWGLGLQFDESQPNEPRRAEVMGIAVPTILPGRFAAQGQGNCRLWSEGLAVTCAIGKGRVLALADAAVLDRSDPDGAGAKGFGGLLDSAFLRR